MKTSNIYKIRGMHCASCAHVIEKTFKKTEGVESAEVNYATESAKISFDTTKLNIKSLSNQIEPLGYSIVLNEEKIPKNEKFLELNEMKLKLMSAIPLAFISLLIMTWDILSKFNPSYSMPLVWGEFFHHLLPIMATYVLFVVGKPYLTGFYRFLRTGYANMDTLIGLGTSVAFVYSFILTAFEETLLRNFPNVSSTYYDVTIVVITFIALGKYLETKSKLKTGDAIEKLLNLQSKNAIVVRNGVEVEVSVNEVVHGDLIIIKPGSKIPVDGVVVEGSSYVDESMITGEPMPVHKEINTTVSAGTINTNGSFVFKATKIGNETLLAQIIKMVEDAQGSRAPIQALADKVSSVFVPTVLLIAFISLAGWLVLGGNTLGFSGALSYGLVSFVGVLVIACPCALGLATPTAIIVGVGKGAKEGILIKDAATLEKLHKVDTVVVDKTGTITIGRPSISDIKIYSDSTDEKFISLLASLESKSEHPIAHAVVNYATDPKGKNTTYMAEKNIELLEVSNFENLQGKGIKGIINGVEYFAGNVKLVNDLGIVFDAKVIEEYTKQGKTPVILAKKENVLGFVMVSDGIKNESKQAVIDLHRLGIKVVMLTGDDERAAKYMAGLVGIDEVVAHVMPEDKLNKIKELQSQGHVVAMAGDGVNDAPALAQADVGIAMGTGTDVAIESAGITLLDGDMSKLVKSIKLSRMTMRGIKQNLFFAFIYNIIGIPLASGIFFPFFGWLLSPVFAGFAMAMSSVSVVSNSLRIKSKKL